MKREELEKLGLTKEQIDTIMAENGKDIEASKTALAAKEQELATKTTEAEGYKTQLSDRDKDIKELKKQAGNSEELNTKLAELQTKYDTETTSLKTKLDEQALDHATEKFFTGVEFASGLAKEAAIAKFKSKGLKYENDKFLGGDDFIAELKKTDPAAFKPEEKEDDNLPPPPQFVAPTGNQAQNKDKPNPFNFGFSEVRTVKTK